jgi:hypothetical protein
MPIAEMSEFASFLPRTQRYIRRSLSIVRKEDAIATWARDGVETAEIKAQSKIYEERIDYIRHVIPESPGLMETECLMSPLVTMSSFDVGQSRLPSFSSYRFLYERIFGARIRPWLPSAFLASASMPQIEPEKRKDLLQSISESAASARGWSMKDPVFFPSWIDKESLEPS